MNDDLKKALGAKSNPKGGHEKTYGGKPVSTPRAPNPETGKFGGRDSSLEDWDDANSRYNVRNAQHNELTGPQDPKSQSLAHYKTLKAQLANASHQYDNALNEGTSKQIAQTAKRANRVHDQLTRHIEQHKQQFGSVLKHPETEDSRDARVEDYKDYKESPTTPSQSAPEKPYIPPPTPQDRVGMSQDESVNDIAQKLKAMHEVTSTPGFTYSGHNTPEIEQKYRETNKNYNDALRDHYQRFGSRTTDENERIYGPRGL